MIPLLYCALADTVMVEVSDDVLFVHEWGVVEIDNAYLEVQGAMDGYIDEDGFFWGYIPVEAEAPVVWFHGAECTGSFFVELYGGQFTTTLPRPDTIELFAMTELVGTPTCVAVWQNLNLSRAAPEIEEERMSTYPFISEDFTWALPLWREVPGLYVSSDDGSWFDRFLYYECATIVLSNVFHAGATAELPYDHLGESLILSADEGELVIHLACSRDEFEIIEMNLSMDDVMEHLCDWAGGGLKSSELNALWETWVPRFRTRCIHYGERLMLFPLSQEQVESISRIRFEPDEDIQVLYDRLFLGLGAI